MSLYVVIILTTLILDEDYTVLQIINDNLVKETQ